MKVRLSARDIELICFLGRYKQIKSVDCKKLYKSKDYYRKRLKVLEIEKYIKREKGHYIKLDIEGRRLLQDFGYENHNQCRNKDYKERIRNIAKIAMLAFEDGINFTPSWEIKNNNIYTEYGRKYIGILEILQDRYWVYYISNRNNPMYVRQMFKDISKINFNDKVIVFSENFNIINKRNKYFIMSDKSIQIIEPTEENLELISIIKDVNEYDIENEIYKGKEILLSNWDTANFMTEDGKYIIFMPFIDTEKIHRVNIAYNDNKETNKQIDILTLKENKKKIEQMLVKETNIIEIDMYVEKIGNENYKQCFL